MGIRIEEVESESKTESEQVNILMRAALFNLSIGFRDEPLLLLRGLCLALC